MSRSGNGVGMSGEGGCGGGVDLVGCTFHSGVGLGLAGSARLCLGLDTSFSSCGNPVSKNARMCHVTVRTGPMLFRPCCRTSRRCSGMERVLCNGCKSNGCIGPCTRMREKCHRCDGGAVLTRLNFGRRLSVMARKLSTQTFMGVSHCTRFSTEHR